MVTKTKKQGEGKGKMGRIKVLSLRKETVKDFSDEEAKQVKGGTTRCLVTEFCLRDQTKLGYKQNSVLSTV